MITAKEARDIARKTNESLAQMAVKEVIQFIRESDDLIQRKEEELKRLESRCGLQGVNFEPKSGVPNPNRLEKLYLDVIEFKQELELLKQSTIKERVYMDKLISHLDDNTVRCVMYDYVLSGYTPKQLASKYYYTKSYVYKLIRSGIEQLETVHKSTL